jgi:hypothetical protein
LQQRMERSGQQGGIAFSRDAVGNNDFNGA